MTASTSPHESSTEGQGRTLAAGLLTLLTAAGVLVGGTPGTAEAAPSCDSLIGIGVPGTNQGAAHAGDETDADALFGPQVAAVMAGLSTELPGFAAYPVSYPALGLGGWLDVGNAVTAKVNYDASEYKASKDIGYANTRASVDYLATQCPNARFIVVGYSQGGHVAGDLAQSIINGEGPISEDRLAGVVLLSDPAFNGDSPQSTEFRYDGPEPTEDGFDATKHKVVADADHWSIHGSMGTRSAYPNTPPILSYCVYGDPICDNNAAGLGGYDGFEVQEKAWMHELYTSVRYTDTDNLATHSGKYLAWMLMNGMGG